MATLASVLPGAAFLVIASSTAVASDGDRRGRRLVHDFSRVTRRQQQSLDEEQARRGTFDDNTALDEVAARIDDGIRADGALTPGSTDSV